MNVMLMPTESFPNSIKENKAKRFKVMNTVQDENAISFPHDLEGETRGQTRSVRRFLAPVGSSPRNCQQAQSVLAMLLFCFRGCAPCWGVLVLVD